MDPYKNYKLRKEWRTSMSKKILSVGGAALVLLTFLVLIGCHGAGDSIPPKPVLSVAKVILAQDALIVTFNAPLAEVDKALGNGYTLIKENYSVSKAGTNLPVGSVEKGETANSVKLTMPNIHDGLADQDTFMVTLRGLAAWPYIVKAPVPVSAQATSPTTIAVAFSDSIAAGDITKTQFTIAGTNVTNADVTAVAVAADIVTLTASSMAGLTEAVTDLIISYTPDESGTKLAGFNKFEVVKFTDYKVDTSTLALLTAAVKGGEPNSDAALTLEFSEELYDANGKLVASADVLPLFVKAGIVVISSATLGADLKTVTFVLVGAGDTDTIVPNPAGTVLSAKGAPWKGEATFTTADNWKVTTP
jgi:hypothetical protein